MADNSDKKLTVEDVEVYLHEGFAHCPFPNCKNDYCIEGDGFEVDGDVATQDCTCTACGGSWQDIYFLKNAQNLE